MKPEYRRFILKGTRRQQKALMNLIKSKNLSRKELILILHTIAFRHPSSDTLMR
jgi:hypothetical protein